MYSKESRIKFLKNLIKISQTAPMVNTVKTVEQNKVTPAKPAQPAKPANTPNTPKTNVIAPPDQNNNQQVPENTIQTTPIIPTKQEQQQEQQQNLQEEEKQANTLYGLVKSAIEDNKNKILEARCYYKTISKDNEDYLKNNYLVYKTANNINKFGKLSKNDLINNKVISMYEPVIGTTNYFSITIKDSKVKEVSDICKKLGALNIDTSIYKTKNGFKIKCSSSEDLDTNIVLAYMKSICDESRTNFNELKVGELKRVYFSMDEEVIDGALIRIG